MSVVDSPIGGRTAKNNSIALGSLSVAVSSMLGAGVAHADALAHDTDADGDYDNDGKSVEQVTVSGVRSLLSDKLSGEQLDTPQSLTVVTDKIMSEQANTRLEDALKNVPGITLNSGEGAARGDTVNLRGFSAFNDFFLDGIRDAAVYTRDSFNLQSVEVVKGPSATLFGRGSTGGAINQVSKAPFLEAADVVQANLGTNSLYRMTADLNQPFAETSAFRLNLMGESSDVADRDFVHNRRWGFAPSASFGINTPDMLTLAYLHQQENNVPDSGIPFVDGRPAPVPRWSYYGLSSDSVTTHDDIATARYKHDFSTDLLISDTLRYAHYEFSYLGDMPNFGASPPGPQTPLQDILVGRDRPASTGVQSNLTEQIDLVGRLETGFIRHTLNAGFEWARQTLDLTRLVNPFNSNNSWVPETPLLSPDPYEAIPVEGPSSHQDTVAHSTSFYLTDTLALGPYLDLIAGARYDKFSADYRQLTVASGAQLLLDHTDRLGSPRGALIFKPTATQSYYFSFGTSFDPSAEALSLTAKTANLGPVKGKTYEVGTKDNLLDGQLLVTGALFHTVVDNAQTNDPENPTLTVLNGNQRVNGLEASASGYLTKHLELFAGYTYLDGKTIASGTAADVGKPLQNVAKNALNLWTEYEFTDQWEAGVGGNWLGRRYADFGGAVTVPGYVVWNAMVSYKVSKSFSVQLNGLNLFNRFYYDAPYYTSVSENHVIPGAGRSGVLTLRMTL
ncbi:MAG TPA: TonB-dependent siderophore receptor [Steroidobacteraceae bacterium]|nr:TonB-dependent siderophore receptor [Steroidobacteraceae bacterium]